jgi:hypothetical protein
MAYSKKKLFKRHLSKKRLSKRKTYRKKHTRRSKYQKGRGVGFSAPINETDMDPIWMTTNLNDVPLLARVIGEADGGEERARYIINENIINKIARDHPDFQAIISEMERNGQLSPVVEKKIWIGVLPTEEEKQERSDMLRQRREKMNKILLSWFKTQKKLGNIGNEYNEAIEQIRNEYN